MKTTKIFRVMASAALVALFSVGLSSCYYHDHTYHRYPHHYDRHYDHHYRDRY